MFQYIAELSLLEAEPYLQFKPSVIAAAALATARHCLLCERDDCHERRGDDDQIVHPECANVGKYNLSGIIRELLNEFIARYAQSLTNENSEEECVTLQPTRHLCHINNYLCHINTWCLDYIHSQ